MSSSWLCHSPVDITNGIFFVAACCSNGKLLASPEPIFKNGTANEHRTSTETLNKSTHHIRRMID